VAEIVSVTLLAPNSGSQSADLNPNGPSSVHQDIATHPGHVYQVSFALAGNPGYGGPEPKTLTVAFGVSSQDLHATSSTSTNMQWSSVPGFGGTLVEQRQLYDPDFYWHVIRWVRADDR
jgi:hypothetical protein